MFVTSEVTGRACIGLHGAEHYRCYCQVNGESVSCLCSHSRQTLSSNFTAGS